MAELFIQEFLVNKTNKNVHKACATLMRRSK